MKYFNKPVTVEATQWWKNGDHPHDGPAHLEGKVVRYYRDPSIDGLESCNHCGRNMHDHGFIDTKQGGHVVCPGDYIINEPDGNGYYPCKPNVFEQRYYR